jgi:hypothetical protein
MKLNETIEINTRNEITFLLKKLFTPSQSKYNEAKVNTEKMTLILNMLSPINFKIGIKKSG